MAFSPLLRVFFQWLYHPLAFAYDLVAAVVSLGHWNQWSESTLPHLAGTHILELGFGPGHLQLLLRRKFEAVYGLDESMQMGRIARDRLTKVDRSRARTLVRGLAQEMPFSENSFDCLVASFPSEYISDDRTLSEVFRVLVPGGRFVILPAAWPHNRLLAWLFRVTGEVPSEPLDLVKNRLITPFQRAGLQTEVKIIHENSGIIMIIIAKKEA